MSEIDQRSRWITPATVLIVELCVHVEHNELKFWQFDEILKPNFDSGNPYVSTFLSVPSIRPFSKRYQRLLIIHLMLPIRLTR